MGNVLRGWAKKGPSWLGVLQMAEDWGQAPETILTVRRGPLWAARWACYKQEQGKAQRGETGAAPPLDGEPEWVALERQLRAG